mgnify:CR=1 FL=1
MCIRDRPSAQLFAVNLHLQDRTCALRTAQGKLERIDRAPHAAARLVRSFLLLFKSFQILWPFTASFGRPFFCALTLSQSFYNIFAPILKVSAFFFSRFSAFFLRNFAEKKRISCPDKISLFPCKKAKSWRSSTAIIHILDIESFFFLLSFRYFTQLK